jgi:hypothetical protein
VGGVAVAWRAFGDWHVVSGEDVAVYWRVCDLLQGKSSLDYIYV